MKTRLILNYFFAFQELIIAFFLSKKMIWNLVNASAINAFNISPPILSRNESDILEDIKVDGYSVTDINIFDSGALENIQSYQQNLNPSSSNVKTFLTYFLGGNFGDSIQYFDEINPLLELSLNERLVSIVNSYFKMQSSLCYLELNETHLSNNSNPQKSQNFHKDPGINKCIKVFLYLNDVEMETGPFTYVRSSHRGKKGILKQKRYGAGGVYPKKNILRKLVNHEDIIPICGKAGTLILADTTGLHCGGNSLSGSRKMATLVYYPPGDLKKSKIHCKIKNLNSSFPASKYLLYN
jgi:hypothetical protein